MDIALLLPAISAGLNRKWRGEAQAPRFAWYGLMALMAYALTLDMAFTVVWGLFLLGYAVLPWHAMFSAMNGKPPKRKDHPAAQWMQSVAHFINDKLSEPDNAKEKWQRYGIVYGAVRALPMMPAVLLLSHYSPLWYAGAALFLMGYVYFLCGKLSVYFKATHLDVAFAEIVMGWALATYLLILI